MSSRKGDVQTDAIELPMSGKYDSIKLALPSRKVPIGKFVVSDDNEYLIVFKDSIGIFSPNLKLSYEMQTNTAAPVGNRMKFFTPPQNNQSNFPITFVPSNVHCSRDVARYALTHCERSAIAMSTKILESKDFLSFAFRNADWSPPGVDKMSRHSIRLSALDRTYAVKFDPPNLRTRPNFIKIIDISGEHALLVIAFADSRIICATYQAYAKQLGVISVKRLNESELCPCSSGFIPVSDAAYSGDVLAIAYGTRVLLAKIINHTTVRLLVCLSDDAILKAISGVRFFNNCVYLSSQDGIIAKAAVPTQLNKNYDLTILNKASALGGKNFHRFFGGLHLTHNGVYAAFVESTVAPAFCNITSNLVFMALLSNSEVVDLIDGLSAPMRRNVDCLYQVTRLLLSAEYKKSVSLACSSVDMDLETWSQKLLTFSRRAFFDTKVDCSKLELHKLQFQRAIAMLLVEESNIPTDMKQALQTQIDRLDKILALRQIDQCYRLFLKTEVQRQSQDCILVLRIAALCQRFLQSDAANDCGVPALCSMLHRATEAVTSVAQKLLIRRFERTLSDVNPTALLVCPVCRKRCASTFIPCVDPCFNECPSCRRCSVLPPASLYLFPPQSLGVVYRQLACKYIVQYQDKEMNSFEVNHRVAADAKVESGRESSNFANRLNFMKRIRKPDKRRATTTSVHSDFPTDSSPKESNASSDIVTVKLTGSQEKFTKSLTDENDALRNKNTMLRYQVELLSEQLNDLRDVNMDLRNQNSRIREENSVLRNEQTQLSARNDCLVEQIIVLQKMLEDMGVSVDDTSGYPLDEIDATETPGDDVDGGDDGTSCNGNPGTPASYRKPPLHCDKNLDFL
ncbi:hypothetical protein TSMEX_010837 [Taenia solium]|eukprot:TsM_000399000 transcript=TsM_000399000 gene=TsM_000399000